MVDVSTQISPSERLARDMSSKQAKSRAERQQSSLWREFLPRFGASKVSVDRIDCSGEVKARELAEARADAQNRDFFGWSIIVVAKAARNGRTVVSSPTTEPDNPYHADIVLPTDDRDRQKEHAQQLAAAALWQPADR